MPTIDQLTHAAVISRDMNIPVSLFGQNLRITIGQLIDIVTAQPEDIKVQYSADGETWHDEYRDGDQWMRISQDGGKTWGGAININATEGQPGADGATYYTWIKYSDIANPQFPEDIYDLPRESTMYMGLSFNRPTPVESNNPALYQWIRIRGVDGNSLTDVGEYYAVGNSATIPPSLGLFVQVPPNAMPEMTRENPYLWNYERTYFTDGNIVQTDPALIGTLGADGVGIQSVVNYYLASKRGSGVTKEDTEDERWTSREQEATVLFGEEYPFLWNYEVIIYTNLRQEATEPHIIGHWGSSGLTIDLDNEMDTVLCNESGKVTAGLPLTTTARMWVGQRQLKFDTLTASAPDGVSVTADAKTGEINVTEIADSVEDKFYVKIEGKSGDYEGWRNFTVVKSKAPWMYNILTEPSVIKKGSTKTVNILLRQSNGRENNVLRILPSGLSAWISKDEGAYERTILNTPINVENLETSLSIHICEGDTHNQDKLVDVETIPVLISGGFVTIVSTDTSYALTTSSVQPKDEDFIYKSIDDVLRLITNNKQAYYIWVKTITVYSDSTSATNYSVQRLGADGDNGVGIPGTSSFLHLAYATNVVFDANTSMATSVNGFSTVYDRSKKYIGMLVNNVVQDPGESSALEYRWNRYVGDGVTIVSTEVRYAKGSADGSQPNDSQFTAATVGELKLDLGDWMWSRTKVAYSDGSETVTYASSRLGDDGDNADQNYNHFAYASDVKEIPPTSASQVEGFSTTAFEDAVFWGFYTDFTTEDSKNPLDYKWAKIGLTEEDKNKIASKAIDHLNAQIAPIASLSPASINLKDNTTYSITVRTMYIGDLITDVTVSIPSVASSWLTLNSVTINKSLLGDGGETATVKLSTTIVPANANIGEVTFNVSLGTKKTSLALPYSIDPKITIDNDIVYIRGVKASDSLRGKEGTSVATDVAYFLASSLSSGVTTSTTGWTTSLQTTSESRPYLWSFRRTTLSTGTYIDTVPQIIGNYAKDGTNGTNGKTFRPSYSRSADGDITITWNESTSTSSVTINDIAPFSGTTRAGALSGVSDFDDVPLVSGNWTLNVSRNLPGGATEPGYYFLQQTVHGNGNSSNSYMYVEQRATRFGHNTTYVRLKDAGAWGKWERVIGDNLFTLQNIGGTISYGDARIINKPTIPAVKLAGNKLTVDGTETEFATSAQITQTNTNVSNLNQTINRVSGEVAEKADWTGVPRAGRLSDGNLNNAPVVSGKWSVNVTSNGPTRSDGRTNGWHWLEQTVHDNGNGSDSGMYIIQRATYFYGNETYVRRKDDTGWHDWNEVLYPKSAKISAMDSLIAQKATLAELPDKGFIQVVEVNDEREFPMKSAKIRYNSRTGKWTITSCGTSAAGSFVGSSCVFNDFGGDSSSTPSTSATGTFWGLTWSAGGTVNGTITPGANNSYTCGTSTRRWSTVYSNAGNFSGNVEISGTLKTGENISCEKTTASSVQMSLRNSNSSISLALSTEGWGGLYNSSKSQWVMLSNTTNTTFGTYNSNNGLNTSYTLFVGGTIGCSGSLSQNTGSDIRLKRDFGTEDYIGTLRKIGDVVTFKYTEEAGIKNSFIDPSVRHTGVIYQNAINADIPEFTGENEEGYGFVNYLSPDYQATFLGAFKQLDLNVQELTNENNFLKRKTLELENEVNDLKKLVTDLLNKKGED